MAAQGDVEAGNAFIRMWLKSENVGDFFNTLGKKITAFGQRLNAMGKRMAVTAIVMAMPFVAGTKVFADFSKQMAFVSTMLDDSQMHMGEYTKAVRNLSLEFGEGTEAISRGLYDILSASFAPEKALRILNVTMRAGKAGMTDTANATRAIVAVLNAYGLEAERAQYVSDALFTVVRYGVLTFGDLAGHIGLVASSAAIANVSIEEMGALLAVMTRAGVEASHAVVALNNIIKAFIKPTESAVLFAKKLREAGVHIELSTEHLKKTGIINVFKEISKLRPEAIAVLFPTIRALRGVTPALAKMEGLLDTYSKFKDVSGATDKAFRKVMDSFGILVDRAKQAGILILSYIGEALADSLKGAGEAFIYFAKGFGKWIKENKAMVVNVAKLVVVYMKLALVLLVVGKAIAVVGIVTSLLSGPGGLIKLALSVAAGVAAWQLLGKAMAGIKDQLSEITRMGKDVTKVELGMAAASATLAGQAEIVGKRIAIERERWEELKDGVREARKEVEDLEQAKIRASISVVALPLVPSVIRELQSAKELLNTRILEHRVLRDTVKALEKKQKFLEREASIVAASEKRQLSRQKALRVEEEARAAATRFARRGFYLGYWHTPSLAYAASSPQTQQIELLRDIKENTGKTAAAVKNIGKAT